MHGANIKIKHLYQDARCKYKDQVAVFASCVLPSQPLIAQWLIGVTTTSTINRTMVAINYQLMQRLKFLCTVLSMHNAFPMILKIAVISLYIINQLTDTNLVLYLSTLFTHVLFQTFLYSVIQNDCRDFDDLSYTIHLR